MKNGTEEALAEAVTSFEGFLRAVHPITFSCYTSVSEFSMAGDYYVQTLENFSMLSYNVIH